LNVAPPKSNRSPGRPKARLNLSSNLPDPGAQEDPTINLRGILLTLWRAKWIIVISTFIATIFGMLTISQAGPVYSAHANVMFGFQRSNVTNMQNVLVDQKFDNAALQDQIEILKSTVLTERVIKELSLDKNPRFNPTLRVPVPTMMQRIRNYISLPPEIADLLKNTGVSSSPRAKPDPKETERRIRLAVISNVQSGLQLLPVGQSRVISIRYVSDSPKLAAAIANSYAEQYIVDQLEAKLEAANAATTWLAARVEELRVRVEESEQAIETALLELSGKSGQSLEVTQQQLQALNASLASVTSEKSHLQALYNRLTLAIDADMDLGTISEFRTSSLIQRYRSQEIDILAQKAGLEETVPEGHPSLKRLDQQLEVVRRNIKEEAGRIVSATFLDMEAAKAQEDKLIEEVHVLEQKVLLQTGNQSKIRQMEREVDASRALYNSFLTRLQETTAQTDLQEADARLLSPAEVPLYPQRVAQRRTLIVITLLGTFVGIALAFLLDRLNNTFRSPVQLEELTGESLLGVLPAIGSKIDRKDVIAHLKEKPGSSMAEAIRNLRTSILFSDIDEPPKVVAFTSSVPREGKSTTSMLVALTSRQMGKSTVIVDCDLRLPTLAGLINSKDHQAGLMSVLAGSSTIEEAVYKDSETGLHVLTTVGQPINNRINAADILSSRKFETLIKELSEIYDLVILDTPPTLVVADTRIISKLADAVVYAVKYDSTPRGAVLEGLKDLRYMNAPIIGVVLTMVNESRAGQFTYDGYNYYKGRYGDYYTA
jgi:capsular exopolysaccharide synthesis family protein